MSTVKFEQQTLWDVPAAVAARNEAVAAVGVSHAPWVAVAYDAIVAVAEQQHYLTADDVWPVLDAMGIARPVEQRAMGAAMVRAIKRDIIERIGYIEGSNPKHHRNPHGHYRSLVYRG